MTRHSATKSRDPGPERSEPTAAHRPAADVPSRPRRMAGLARGMARCREELLGMRREAVIALEDAISRLGALERCSRPGLADELLAELEAALVKVRILDHGTLPRPEHLFAIADRLSRLNLLLPSSREAADGGGPADAGDDRQPPSGPPVLHNTIP